MARPGERIIPQLRIPLIGLVGLFVYGTAGYGSPMVGKDVGHVSPNSTPLLARRAHGALITNPGTDVILERGDLVVLLGEPKALERAD